MKAIINARLVFPDEIMEGNLLIEGKNIVAAGKVEVPADAEIIDARGLFVGPGLTDQHCHGYQQYGEEFKVVDDPVATAKAHLKHGTTNFIPSTDYKFNVKEHLNILDKCRTARDSGESTIMGVHMEGPFINKKYGAMSDLAMDYSDEVCEEMFEAGKGLVLHCTYAPELKDAPRIEERMVSWGIRPAIGHCAAGPEDIERAVAGGACIATHLYDAMGNYMGVPESSKMTGHPQDCTADILLGIPGIYYELICDSAGAHATKYSIRKAYRAAGEDHIILISDATVRPTAGKTGDINFNERGQLSGSRLCINMAVKNFMKYTGADIRVAFKCGSTNSARALGLQDKVGSITAGHLANILLVDEEFTIKKIFFLGEEVEEVRN